VVAVISGNKPTTGHEIEIDWICKEPPFDDNPWVIHFTMYTPADNCPVYEVTTQPYHVVVTEKFQAPYEWEDAHKVYECPEENCLNFELLAEGNHSGWHEENIRTIETKYEWHAFWNTHAPGETPPQINWENHFIVAFAMGDYPTTGYWVDMLKICWNDNEDAWVIEYAFFIPGGSVETYPVVTQPFAYYIVVRPDLPIYLFDGEEIVYQQQG